jgi:HPt (histidine-containing phosphotransfer) domain-containing protein
MDDYVSKPLRSDDLRRIVATWSAKAKQRKALPAKDRGKIDEALIDLEAIRHIRELGGTADDAFLQKVVEMYRKQAPALVASIRSYHDHSEADKAKHAAHKLKSSSLNLGAVRMGKLAERIEIRCGEAGKEELGKLVADLEAAWQATDLELGKVVR